VLAHPTLNLTGKTEPPFIGVHINTAEPRPEVLHSPEDLTKSIPQNSHLKFGAGRHCLAVYKRSVIPLLHCNNPDSLDGQDADEILFK
jgi:hypothetical protein